MRSVFGYFKEGNLNINSTHQVNHQSFYGFLESNSKFVADKVFYQTDQYIFVLDGVILNKTKLIPNGGDWKTYLLNAWLTNPGQLLKSLRGEFSGFVFDKISNALQVFNNPTGTKNIFVFHNNNEFAFASSAIDLITLVRNLEWSLDISTEACYSFLAYGSLLNGASWLNNSKKIEPGSLLTFNTNEVDYSLYKTFEITPSKSFSKPELFEEFDKLMQNAVRIEWEKDTEYGYKHFATLSGGLDSRVNVMLARKLGFVDQDNFCCSKKGYSDELISREMAYDFGHQYYFHALDGLEHFKKAEYMLDKLGGSTVFMGPAHLRYGLDKNWKSDYGIVHSGQWGDGVLGGFISSTSLEPVDISFGRESFDEFPENKKFDEKLQSKYPNQEMFKFHERALQIANAGFWILEDLSYYSSPFCDIDVLDFLMKLPYSLKYKRQFYMEWIIKYYPEMTEYKWEYIHSKPNALWKIKYATQFMRLKYGVRKILSPKFRASFDMTPEQYWYDNSEEVQQYYKNKIEFYLTSIETNSYPYKEEILKFSKSNNFGQLSKALSILIILNKIIKDD